ncbi:MAG: penicillin-binding protein 2 [Thermoanaerobacterales bacterium]|nr:penicillin-binding protein 2 [Thermoanaerobacterales bacterium]
MKLGHLPDVNGNGNARRREHHVPRLRLSLLTIVAVALFASLFARLYDLQVIAADDYQVRAEANRVRTVQIPAPRGRILDRNGKVIVDNRVAVVVAIDRSIHEGLEPEEQEDVVNRLAMELTGAGFPTSPDDIRARLEDDRFNRYAPVPIAVDVPEELKIYFEEHTAEYPSVVVERKAVRSYPYGSLAAHIVGYVGKINEAELEAVADEREKPYGLNDEIGKSGVEQTFERYLRGTPGIRRIEVDSQGDPVRVISETPPVPGDDLVLTIDLDVQALAEQKLRQGLEAARARPNRDGTVNNATTGSTVVIDPNNGQIIAMASYPSYDPSTFVDGIDAAEWAALNDPANHYPLNNWAIQGQWAPGSTYKLFVGHAALMAGVMEADTVFSDRGGYQIPGCSGAKCYRRNAGGAVYGNITLPRAITISSDAYFYHVGAQFWLQRDRFGGDEAMQNHLVTWGLGDRTGVALTSEAPGRVPTPAWKRDYCDRVNCNDGVWRTGDNVNMAIGQGDVLVTPLQLANGYATFANGGTRYVPQIALRTQAYQTGEVTAEFQPEVAGQVDLPPEVREPLYEGLVNVPVSGTASRAFAGFPLDRYPIAGKTGTAQVDGKSDTAVFAAFGPAPAPEYAVAVVMEESGFGGTAAAPVARALFEALSGTTPLPPAAPNAAPVGGEQPLVEAGASYD